MKKNFSSLSAECGEKKFSPLKWQILQIFTDKFNAYLKFAGNIIEVSDRWRNGIRCWWHAVGEWFQPQYGSFFFVKNPVNAVKRNFSTLNSTQILQKFTAFTAFSAKRCGCFAVKKVFSPLFTANLTLFFDKTSTRVSL